jgi:MFS family permease
VTATFSRETAPPGGALAPFKYPVFRAIWTANLLSSVGSIMQSVAAAWLMTELTTRHLLVALVQASATIPILLLGVIAGAIADSYDRRVVMLWAQSLMLVVSAALSALGFLGAITPWSLLLLTLMVGIGTALNAPAWQASVRLQVDRQDLPQAVSINAIAANLARSLGPALGGIVISIWSVNAAFALNAVSYLAMIVVLARWRPDVAPPVRMPIGSAILTGVTFCVQSGPIARVLLRGLVFGFGAAGLQALLPVVVRVQLHGDQISYGIVLGSFGTGSVLCALMVSKMRRRFGSEAIVGASTIAYVCALVMMSWSQTLPPAMLAACVAGAGWVALMTSLNVAIQMRAPEAILARCLSMYQAVAFGGMALGAWVWGSLADHSGLVIALRLAACWLALTMVMRFIAPMPTRDEGRIEPAQTNDEPVENVDDPV